MNLDINSIKQYLFSITVIEEGINVYKEILSDEFTIDDHLLSGFISSLYSYTFAMGHEKIEAIDFTNHQFFFAPTYDEKLLVLITSSDLEEEEGKKALDELNLRYEVLSQDHDILQMPSLIEKQNRLIPIEIVAEIRRKKNSQKPIERKMKNEISSETIRPSPQIAIPKIVTTNFYLVPLTGENYLSEKSITKAKKTLSNFFLGYRNIVLLIMVIPYEEDFISFVFSRERAEEILPMVNKIIQSLELTEFRSKDTNDVIEPFEIGDNKMWVSSSKIQKNNMASIVLSTTKNDLRAISPHLKRIMRFMDKLIKD